MRVEYTKLVERELWTVTSGTYAEALVIAKRCREAEHIEDEDEDSKSYPQQPR
jgi:20S proteasome alpha/beta subunit